MMINNHLNTSTVENYCAEFEHYYVQIAKSHGIHVDDLDLGFFYTIVDEIFVRMGMMDPFFAFFETKRTQEGQLYLALKVDTFTGGEKMGEKSQEHWDRIHDYNDPAVIAYNEFISNVNEY